MPCVHFVRSRSSNEGSHSPVQQLQPTLREQFGRLFSHARGVMRFNSPLKGVDVAAFIEPSNNEQPRRQPYRVRGQIGGDDGGDDDDDAESGNEEAQAILESVRPGVCHAVAFIRPTSISATTFTADLLCDYFVAVTADYLGLVRDIDKLQDQSARAAGRMDLPPYQLLLFIQLGRDPSTVEAEVDKQLRNTGTRSQDPFNLIVGTHLSWYRTSAANVTRAFSAMAARFPPART